MLTQGQGLVTPCSSIPTLIAMSTHHIIPNRNNVVNLLEGISSTYVGMVPVRLFVFKLITYSKLKFFSHVTLEERRGGPE